MDEMTGLLAQHGLFLVFANVLLTQAGAPVPSTPMLIVAGALAAQGQLGLVLVLAAATFATLLGNVPWYFAGRRYGHRILRTVCRISMEPDSCVQRTEDVFGRWGAISLIVGKNIPGFATLAPPLAGAMRVGLLRFMVYTAISALLWASLPLLVGWIFSTEVEWLLAQLQDLGVGALLVAGTTFASVGTKEGFIALGVFLVYQQVEGNLLQPLIQRRTLKMNPLLIALVMLVGTSLAGLIGALLALPIAGAVQVLLEDRLAQMNERWRTRKNGTPRVILSPEDPGPRERPPIEPPALRH